MNLRIEKLCKAFDGKSVLTNVTHTFEEGRITCILGPSGIGKTTLLRVLMGLTAPDSGSVSGLDGRCCAAVFQEDRLLLHLSALENVRIALKRGFPREEILAALEAVGLGESARKPVRTLSGGMQRRVAIVRALLPDSDVLLMDEPFRGLDAATRAQVIRWMLPKLAGRTVIVVTHSPEEAALFCADFWTLEKND